MRPSEEIKWGAFVGWVINCCHLFGVARAVKATSNRRVVSFGQFRLDLAGERLLKKDLPVRLENQPLQILAALLEHPDEIVSREELCTRLWTDGTYVDFDEGLNTAIKKLRYVLGDSAENPIFIETVPRRGYRFIAPVQKDDQKDDDASDHLQLVLPHSGNGLSLQSSVLDPSPQSPISAAPPSLKRRWTAGLIIVGLAVTAACYLFYRLVFPPALRVTQITRLTNSGHVDPWGGIASDGSRLFFLEREGDHWNNRQVSAAGGESAPFDAPFKNTKTFAVSPDQSEILLVPFSSRDSNRPLWSSPLVGGAPRPVGDIVVDGAVYSPDGTKIAFTNPTGVYVANRDGSDVRQLAGFHAWAIDWSPNGRILRFAANAPAPGPHLWQVSSSGRDLHPFLPRWNAFDGHWTSNGSYYIFSAFKDGGQALWAVRETSWPLRRQPMQLTFPPIAFASPLPSRDGRSIYAYGAMSGGIDVVHFDPGTHRFWPVLSGLPVEEVSYSPDRQWMLFSSGSQLWRSRPDGTARVRLVEDPATPSIHGARWSKDSKHILFENTDGGLKGAIYLVSVDGGHPQLLLSSDPSTFWPDPSPDGKTVVFAMKGGVGKSSSSEQGLYLFDFDEQRSTLIPGSAGLDRARWSPDGRFLAAVSEDTSVIKLLDLKTHRWSEIAHGTVISFPVWSADSVLYFQDILAPGEPVYRFQPGAFSPQRAYSFEDILQSGVQRCGFQGFAPEGSLLVQVNRGGGDIYALTVSLP
jgi:DNA-binding winged helix-turn-helix (wHTH) protein/Tol biopolymer transport system component